jgi:hypothetical protein
MAEVGDKDSTRALPSFEDSNWWPLLDAIAFTSLHFNSVRRAGLKLYRALVSDELLSVQERMDGERELLRGWGDVQFELLFSNDSPGEFSGSVDDCQIVSGNELLNPHFIFVWGPDVERLCGLVPSAGPSETIIELSAVVDEPPGVVVAPPAVVEEPAVKKPPANAGASVNEPEVDEPMDDEPRGGEPVDGEPREIKRRNTRQQMEIKGALQVLFPPNGKVPDESVIPDLKLHDQVCKHLGKDMDRQTVLRIAGRLDERGRKILR